MKENVTLCTKLPSKLEYVFFNIDSKKSSKLLRCGYEQNQDQDPERQMGPCSPLKDRQLGTI